MILMGKKGISHTKTISRTMIGVRELEGGGNCVHIQLDEFELFLSAEKAESLAAQLTSKVRKVRDLKEQDELDQKRKAQEAIPQKSLPLTTEGT